jgi:hypothetical protein
VAITLSAATEEAAINAACNAIVDRLDAGSGPGHIRLTLANGTTEVATCVGQDPFFGNASSGIAAQNGSATDPDATGNVAAVTLFQARDSTNTQHWSGTVAESSADLNVDDGTPGGGVIIPAGSVVTLSSIQFIVEVA